MKRAAIFVACVFVLAACVNDFDALFDGPEGKGDADAGKSSSGASGGGGDDDDDDDVTIPAEDSGEPQSCNATACEATTATTDKGQTITADTCCTYTTTCKSPSACTTTCTNGAICEGSCFNELNCGFEVTASQGSFVCDTSFCSMNCTKGSTCSLVCHSEDCAVTCDEGSRCQVEDCFGNCDVTCGNGKPGEKCGDGAVACGGCQ